MDFLDPKKQRQHAIMLGIGYVLIAIAITIATLILLVMAYGYGRGKDGQIIQRGIVFISSTPGGAAIHLNGDPQSLANTNTRQQLIEGTYNLQLQRSGYRDWQRKITVVGGSIAHYDYPFLFPVNLKTTPLKTYAAAPGIVLQSPNQRWLLVQHPDDSTTFDVYDRDNPKSDVTTVTIPSDAVTVGSNQSWELVEWASDNDHVLLKHNYDATSEYIVLDRNEPAKSFNVDRKLSLTPIRISLRNKKYDQYYLYQATDQTLQTASIDNPTPVTYLEHVLDYQSYGSDVMLYVSSASSGKGKVAIDLLQGGKTYNLREVVANSKYLLNITQYSGAWYVALGASSENRVYVYRNPVTQLNSKLGVLVPIAILKTPTPDYVSFSNNARFVTSEHDSQFSVYDAETDTTYNYDTKAVLDAPQLHASWMDGHRLTYVSGGKLMVFDFDHQNVQTLMAANPAYSPFFTSNYKFVDTLSAPDAAGQEVLSTTSLRSPADQ